MSYLRLFRLANVFTAFADIAMGFVFVAAHASSLSLLPLVIGLFASGCLYTAGMVLNDAFDAERDAAERSQRPIPAGEISRRTAFVIGFGLMAVGIGASAVIDQLTDVSEFPWRASMMAGLLASSIVLYDGILKRTPIAPLAMGACRFFNVLLGMCTAAAFEGDENAVWLTFGVPELIVAAGIGVYIAGVTWFARTEARTSNRGLLSFGLGIMISGMILLSIFARFSTDPDRFQENLVTYGPLLFGLVGIVVIRRCIDAIVRPEPQPVQQAIKQSILSLIIFDAAVCLAVAPTQPYYGIFVLALLGPMIFLGRWIPST